MNLIGHLLLSLIPGGGFIHYALGDSSTLPLAMGFNTVSRKPRATTWRFQEGLQHDWTDNVIVIWFLVLLTGYFLPFTQGHVEAGFTSMTASLPPSMQENFHIIVMAVFGVNTAKTVIKHTIAKSGTPEKKEEDPTRHFLFRKGEKNV